MIIAKLSPSSGSDGLILASNVDFPQPPTRWESSNLQVGSNIDNGQQPEWKTTSIENYLNGRRPQ